MSMEFWIYMTVVVYFAGYRNLRAYFFRNSLIDRIHVLNQRDIHDGVPDTWIWRYKVLHEVAWARFFVPFKPFRASAYWKDTRFLMDDVHEVPR
jgi:hypothetical protein